MKTYSVFVCESQPIVVEGLRRVLDSCPEFTLTGAVNSSVEVLVQVGALQPDIVLFDQCIGLKTAMQLIGEMRFLSPLSRGILWANDLGETESLRCLQAGARGIVKKTQPVSALLECLRSVAGGNLWLEHSMARSTAVNPGRRITPRFTPREREIVHHVCQGLKNKQIAEVLAITPGTVKVHLMHIFEKAGVRDRFDLALQGHKLLGSVPGDDAPGSVAAPSS
jgi:two-component system, NarL family, nitrate/nitrite response regulator NarL